LWVDVRKGNDKYDGSFGADTIKEDITAGGIVGTLINNNDIISGGEGDDWIQSGEGYDKIHGGPGSDSIYPNGYSRDFSFDVVNCGSGTGDKVYNFLIDR
jgi:Ca2+-binding RTX toxin-like protein